MAEFWQAVHIRGQQSIGVWGTFAAAFQVNDLTLAMHTADVDLILTHVNERDVQDDVFDDAKLARDQNFEFIRDVVTRVPQLIDAVLPDDDPLNNDLDDVFSVDPDSQHGAMERGRRVVSLWNRVNAKRAAMTPPLPALVLKFSEELRRSDAALLSNYSVVTTKGRRVPPVPISRASAAASTVTLTLTRPLAAKSLPRTSVTVRNLADLANNLIATATIGLAPSPRRLAASVLTRSIDDLLAAGQLSRFIYVERPI